MKQRIVLATSTALLLALALAPGSLAQGRGNGGGNGGGGGGNGGGGGGGGLPTNPNIAYIDLDGDEREIVLFDTQAGESGVLVPGASANSLTWSPDGAFLAYSRQDGQLRVVATDGSGDDWLVVQATSSNNGIDWTRSPAPNGREMILFSDTVELERVIYAVAPDGTDLTPLAVGYTNPRWSPDGSHFVAKGFSGDGTASPVEIFTVAFIDGQLVVVDQFPITMLPGHPIQNTLFGALDWSNDGLWIVVPALEIPSFHSDLWLISPFDPANTIRLTFDGDWSGFPSFDASDERIYFMFESSKGPKTHKLYSVDALVGGASTLESGKEQKSVGPLRARRDPQ